MQHSFELSIIHKFKESLARQVNQVRQGGIREIYRKVVLLIRIGLQLLESSLFLFVSMLFVLLIRVLQPIKKIRFIRLDAGRIGHFSNWAVYLAQKIDGKFSSDIVDIVYFYLSTDQIANKQYLKMWKRKLRVFPLIFSPLLESIQKINESLLRERTNYYGEDGVHFTSHFNIAINNNVTENILKQVDPPISFISKEKMLGQAALRELGIPEETHFICFHARQSAYLDKI